MSKINLALSSISGILAKASSVLTMIILIPMAKNALSPEGFGIWTLLTSFIIVLQFADFGIGNGLVNIISSHHANLDPVLLKQAVSTSIVVLVVAGSLFFTLALTVCYVIVDWAKIFKVTGISSETIRSTLIVFALFLSASIPAVLGQKILWGFQEVHIANLWLIAGSWVNLGLFALFAYLGAGLISLVAISMIGPFLTSAVCTLVQIKRYRKLLMPAASHVSRQMVSKLLRQGGGWTLYQILFFIATSADGLYVTRMFGAGAMSMYGLMMRMFSGATLAIFFSVPFWPLFSSAVARNDLSQIQRNIRLSISVCGFLGLASGIAMYLFAGPIVKIWVGQDLVPSSELVLSFSFWTFIYSVWAGVSSLLSNDLFLRRMVLIGCGGFILTIALKVELATVLGIAGICWASVIGVGVASFAGLYTLEEKYRFVYAKG